MPVPKVKTRFSGRNAANAEQKEQQDQQSPQQQRSVDVSSSLQRPSLLGTAGSAQPQLANIPADAEDSLYPPRPRRLWKVSDTRLNVIPAGFPPMDPRCCIYVADAPPSVVAVRISEALRRLSVAVEYDEETPSATCWTADRCHFVIQLWQGPKSAFSVRTPEIPDLSGGILVEGMRLSGSVMTFHRILRTVLAAAISHDTGEDRRKTFQSNSLEFPRWNHHQTGAVAPLVSNQPGNARETALEALEEAAALLEKDRHDAQTLGMERLVHLTDVHAVGVQVATVAAQSLLGVPPVDEPSALLTNMHHDWMMGLVVHRRLPNEKESSSSSDAAQGGGEPAELLAPQNTTSPRVSRFACTSSSPNNNNNAQDNNNNNKIGGDTTTANDEDNESARVEALLKQMREERAKTGDANHAGRLRGLLMRVWANSLQVLHTHDHVALTTLLQHQKSITSRDFLEVLLQDVEGCSRPPLAAVMGTRLASPHESLWALVALRILTQHSVIVRRHLERTNYAACLEKATLVGSSLHSVLESEAKLAVSVWSSKH